MKEKFLALVEEVKVTGIAEALYKASNAEEFHAAWQKFLDDNKELCTKIENWGTEFKDSGSAWIFDTGEELENPMEIAACIIVINNEEISECEIFEEYEDLVTAIAKIGNNIAIAIAKVAEGDYFCNITAEQVFSTEEDDSDSGEDEEN